MTPYAQVILCESAVADKSSNAAELFFETYEEYTKYALQANVNSNAAGNNR